MQKNRSVEYEYITYCNIFTVSCGYIIYIQDPYLPLFGTKGLCMVTIYLAHFCSGTLDI